MMRKGTGISSTTGISDVPGIRLRRLCRIPLAIVVAVLACVLAAATAAPDTPTLALPATLALKSAGSAPVIGDVDDRSGECAESGGERGRSRRAARTSAGIPQHTGRPLPPCRTDPTSAPAVASGPPQGRGPTPAAAHSRPRQLPVLHCISRC
ncbi:hypothetical protein ACIRPT_04675 [Streptomyces sp. NPDC101227]|uniref:hypothetical protein n=1 Tax=Streptomyces sp. NPDC101227 TaxID=3366136 RepID=UPI003809713C